MSNGNTTDNEIDSQTDSTKATNAADTPSRLSEMSARRILWYLLIAGLVLFALLTALRFYFAASTAISQWVTAEFRSLFQATFNLALLLAAVAGIARLTRDLE